jgi:hypothetical protein
MLTPAVFRQQFAEFQDPQTYQDTVINLWITVAGQLLNCDRWGTLLDFGVSYFVAHHLALGYQNQLTAQAGGVPGKLKGPMSSQSVDKASAGYDTAAISLEDMGFWGTTVYGLRFLQLGRTMGAGGVQVMGGGPPTVYEWPGIV